MPKVYIASRIPEELFEKVRAAVGEGSFDNLSSVVETALRVYFANYTAEVWEKPLPGGWVKKLVVRENKVTFESIRSRKIYSRFNPKQYTDEALAQRGFHKVWKLKKAN